MIIHPKCILRNTRNFDKCRLSTVIDIHSHFLPHSWPNFLEKYGADNGPWPWMRHSADNKTKAMLMVGNEEFRPVESRCWDVEWRLKDMDHDLIDHQIISNTPVLFQYHRRVDQTIDVAKYFNDYAMEMCSLGKGRLHALAQVPLQDIDAACKEASRAMSIGHKGIQIGNHVGPLDLDNHKLVTFLHHCADDDIPVLIHPWDMLGGDRVKNYMMAWTVGMPAETQLSIVAMILGGAFDKLPRKLKICFAHGGGSFAFLLPRLENAWLHRDIARGKSLHPPSHYTDRFSVDSAVFGAGSLTLLMEVMSPQRIMLGSDYPYPLGEQRVGKLIRGMKANEQLTEEQASLMLGENASKFFNIPIN